MCARTCARTSACTLSAPLFRMHGEEEQKKDEFRRKFETIEASAISKLRARLHQREAMPRTRLHSSVLQPLTLM